MLQSGLLGRYLATRRACDFSMSSELCSVPCNVGQQANHSRKLPRPSFKKIQVGGVKLANWNFVPVEGHAALLTLLNHFHSGRLCFVKRGLFI